MDPQSDEKPVKIWTPEEKADDNTKRMAWLLFLEVWKADLVLHECNIERVEVQDVEKSYAKCFLTAKTVRAIEQSS